MIRRCWRGGQRNDTDVEEAKVKRKRGNGRTVGDKEPGRIWEGGRRGEGGPEPSSDGKKQQTKFKGHNLDISQAAVQGMEQHHPIMDKLGGLGGRT